MSTVIVVGAINLDCFGYLPHFPVEGKNLRARDFRFCLGGHGANQAVALNKLKVNSLLIGKVGNDFSGDYVLSLLKRYKINTEYIFKNNIGKTGVCSILVSPNGENTIIGFPAVNRMVLPDFLVRFGPVFELASWLSVSLEYPTDTVLSALKLAKKYGLKTILDPNPIIEAPQRDIWHLVDFVLPNKKELKILTGEEEILQGANVLKDWGAKEVIVKLGAAGCNFLHQDNLINIPAFVTRNIVDTTGAGDSFNAGFVYGMMQTNSIPKSIQIANLVASYSVQKRGTCESFPERRDIDWHKLDERKNDLLF